MEEESPSSRGTYENNICDSMNKNKSISANNFAQLRKRS